MEIVKWDKKDKEGKKVGFMVRVEPEEAIQIIQSLSAQISDNNPNTHRIEFQTINHEYFSIAVHF